jgi:Cdc6-like AAA superfamily ATPase
MQDTNIAYVVGEYVPDKGQARHIAGLLQAALGPLKPLHLGPLGLGAGVLGSEELDVLNALNAIGFDAYSDGPVGLLLQGSAGCGKTALLRALMATLCAPSQSRHSQAMSPDSPSTHMDMDMDMDMGIDCRYIDCAALTLEDR